MAQLNDSRCVHCGTELWSLGFVTWVDWAAEMGCEVGGFHIPDLPDGLQREAIERWLDE